VLLFIDRLPFHSWFPEPGHPGHWSASVPALATEPGLRVPPPPTHWHRWRIDTGYTGSAFVWRHHLLEAGIDPRQRIVGLSRAVLGAGSVREDLLIRYGRVWLFSNIPELRNHPFRLALNPGITFVNRDCRDDPRLATPVIGMRALRDAGVRVRVDCANDTVSLWVPAPWLRTLRVTVQRALTGFRRLPVTWRD